MRLVFWKRRLILIMILFVFVMSDAFGITVSSASPMDEAELEEYALEPIKEEPEKMSIYCFDVNSDGEIVLGFWGKRNPIIAIYSAQNEFLYGFTFQSSGAFAVFWEADNLCILHVRGECVYYYNTEGHCIRKLTITEDGSTYRFLKQKAFLTERVYNNVRYKLINDVLIGDSYGRLEIVYPDGSNEVFYDVSFKHNAKILLSTLCVTACLVYGCYYVFKKNNKTGDNSVSRIAPND